MTSQKLFPQKPSRIPRDQAKEDFERREAQKQTTEVSYDLFYYNHIIKFYNNLFVMLNIQFGSMLLERGNQR